MTIIQMLAIYLGNVPPLPFTDIPHTNLLDNFSNYFYFNFWIYCNTLKLMKMKLIEY